MTIPSPRWSRRVIAALATVTVVGGGAFTASIRNDMGLGTADSGLQSQATFEHEGTVEPPATIGRAPAPARAGSPGSSTLASTRPQTASAGQTGAPSVTAGGMPPATAASCVGSGRTVLRPAATTTAYTAQWAAQSPPVDVTYDLSGITSTAYPSSQSVFLVGKGAPGLRTCVVGGTLHGHADSGQTWSVFHGQYNAACLQIVAVDWMQVRGLRCDNVEDGLRPAESSVNANNARFFISDTYLTRIRDDCIENDYTVGGVLYDNLWEQCYTGISERPSFQRSWATPASETLTLDHMLIGLEKTPYDRGTPTVMGENALFKWSTSGNHVVIKCSIFKVDAVSVNGVKAMAMPPGTVVDDTQCAGTPSTIVWLGGGQYPGGTAGMRVVSDPSVWTDAVGNWKRTHGVPNGG